VRADASVAASGREAEAADASVAASGREAEAADEVLGKPQEASIRAVTALGGEGGRR
jgi:hypothetical protein